MKINLNNSQKPKAALNDGSVSALATKQTFFRRERELFDVGCHVAKVIIIIILERERERERLNE